MKCKKCGKRCNSLKAMGAHYRKKHPSVMKARKSKATKAKTRSVPSGLRYCPTCGREL